MKLTEDNRMSYAFLVANHCAAENLLPFHRTPSPAWSNTG